MQPWLTPAPGSLLAALGRIPDARRRQGQRYPIAGVLGLCVLAALHGESSLRGMWLWARAHWDRIWEPLGFWAPRPPGLSTVWTILAGLPADAVEAVLATWALDQPALAETWLAVDGKVLRGSRRDRDSALRVVALLGQRHRAVVGQRPSREGCEEADATALLRATPLEHCVVTMDAGILKRPQVRAVLEGGGDYLGVIKDNLPEARHEVGVWLDEQLFPLRPPAPAGRGDLG